MSIKQYRHHEGDIANMHRVPKHIAIIMDGNGRWAKARRLTRTKGHREGVKRAWDVVRFCMQHNISTVTLFAFGQENWKRPSSEVRNLFRIFFLVLKRDLHRLKTNNIKLNIVGNRSEINANVVAAMSQAEKATQANTGLTLNIAINYSGKWDILQAMQQWANQAHDQGNSQSLEQLEQQFTRYLSFHGQPEPDLFIRTSGVQRLSNFMLWELAYTEIFFSEVLWPDFDETAFTQAIAFFQQTERRFGLISEQVAVCSSIES